MIAIRLNESFREIVLVKNNGLFRQFQNELNKIRIIRLYNTTNTHTRHENQKYNADIDDNIYHKIYLCNIYFTVYTFKVLLK